MIDVNTLLKGLNDAQREAVLATEGPVLILAGAGSGKTRVITSRVAYLIGSGRAVPQEIIAVTFTNKAAGEMKERVARLLGSAASGARIGTFHALCLRMLRRDGAKVGLPAEFQIYDTADQLGLLKAAMKDLGIDEAELPARSVLSRISHEKNRMVSWEAFSARAALPQAKTIAHCYEEYQKRLRKNAALDFDDLIVETLNLLDSNSDVAERYARACRYLLVDEYQDTNRPQYRLIRALGSAHRNVCVVGDEDQCLDSSTMVTMADGTRKSIARVRPGEQVLSSYGSGDFRPAVVSAVFRKTSRRQGIAVSTAKGRYLVSTPEHVQFAGYRLGLTPQTYFTYLMYKRGVGYRLGTSQVYTRGQARPVVGFRQRSQQEHADALWVVSTHASESEARAEESILSLRYQIPTLPFVPRKGGPMRGLVHDLGYIMKVFRAFDTVSSAARLLRDSGLSADHPHHQPQSRTHFRRNLTVTLCGDHRGATPMHRVSIFGYDADGRRALESLGLSLRPARAGSPGWRFETANKSYGEVLRYVDRIRTVLDVTVVRNARLGKNAGTVVESNSLPFLPASNVQPAMVLFDDEGGYDVVKEVRPVPLDGHVFDLDIESTHNFIANGLVTHNSIYSWRGADVRNILEFESDFPDARIVKMECNYRSTKTILGAAGAVIEKNEKRHAKRLFTENEEGLPIHYHRARDDRDEAEAVARIVVSLGESFPSGEIAVLYRTNNQSRLIEETFVRTGIRYRIVGSLRFYERKEIKDLLAYLRLLLVPEDDLAFLRAVNTPARGVGKTTLDQIAEAAARDGVSLSQAARDAVSSAALTARAVGAVGTFLETLESLRQTAAGGGAIVPLITTLLEAIHFREHLEKAHPGDHADRLENVEALVSAAAEYDEQEPGGGLQGFLDRTSLRSDTDDVQGDSGVTLLTVHSAKGLEFAAVVLTGLEENLFPHSRSSDSTEDLEEERRLFYVAVTRAKKRLVLANAVLRRSFGDFVENAPSRFLDEIPASLLVYSESSAWAGVEGDPLRRGAQPGVRAASTSGLASARPWSGGTTSPAGRSGAGSGYRQSRDRRERSYPDASGGRARSSFGDGGSGRGRPAFARRAILEGGEHDDFAVGRTVTHPMFGRGTILHKEGAGDSLKLTIRFLTSGTRKILPRHTTLVVHDA